MKSRRPPGKCVRCPRIGPRDPRGVCAHCLAAEAEAIVWGDRGREFERLFDGVGFTRDKMAELTAEIAHNAPRATDRRKAARLLKQLGVKPS